MLGGYALRKRHFLAWILPALLLGTHTVLLAVSSRLQSPTRNEVAHVPAGLLYWHTGNFSLYNVNPPLSKMLATLPTLLLNPKMDRIVFPSAPGHRLEWAAAIRFAEDNATNYFSIMWSARLASILWSIFGGVLVYRWAGKLYGKPGGLFALTLWCFEPNVIAHAQLATPDIPATVAGLAATYSIWRYFSSGSWSLAVEAGLLLGLAQLTKFTMLSLYIVYPVLAVAFACDQSNVVFRAVPVRIRLLQSAVTLLLSVCSINLAYGFDRSLTPLGKYEFVSQALRGATSNAENQSSELESGNRFRGTGSAGNWLGTVPIPLPYDYVSGLDIQRRDLEGTGMQPSYLAGEWRQGGWWYYYLYGLAVKVPLGLLELSLWGLVLTLRRAAGSAGWRDELTLWLPAMLVLGLTSSQTGFNHHVRYVLPMAPFVCIATGKLAGYVQRTTWQAGLAALSLLGWLIVSSILVYPHSLSYFNELAGGPDNGYEHLVDSNIDWGQDVYFFKSWIARHPEARPLCVACNSLISLEAAGITQGAIVSPPHPGWYAIDLWNLTRKNGRFEYFRQFKPIGKAGYSIFIYRLTEDDCDRSGKEMLSRPQ